MNSRDDSPDTGIDDAALRAMLKSQYHAALAMLRETIERCPDDLWLDTRPTNAFWQVAYHTLFFAHFYLMPNEAAFRPWHGHQPEVHQPGSLPAIPRPYTRAEALEYWTVCDGMVDDRVDALDLQNPDCGFPWYKMSKQEHQFVSLRHIQHHTAQLVDRLRAAEGIGIRWVGSRHGT